MLKEYENSSEICSDIIKYIKNYFVLTPQIFKYNYYTNYCTSLGVYIDKNVDKNIDNNVNFDGDINQDINNSIIDINPSEEIWINNEITRKEQQLELINNLIDYYYFQKKQCDENIQKLTNLIQNTTQDKIGYDNNYDQQYQEILISLDQKKIEQFDELEIINKNICLHDELKRSIENLINGHKQQLKKLEESWKNCENNE